MRINELSYISKHYRNHYVGKQGNGSTECGVGGEEMETMNVSVLKE